VARVERGRGIVLDAELDALSDEFAGQLGCDAEAEVYARGDAARGDQVAFRSATELKSEDPPGLAARRAKLTASRQGSSSRAEVGIQSISEPMEEGRRGRYGPSSVADAGLGVAVRPIRLGPSRYSRPTMSRTDTLVRGGFSGIGESQGASARRKVMTVHPTKWPNYPKATSSSWIMSSAAARYCPS
jgi:hypothetical protein